MVFSVSKLLPAYRAVGTSVCVFIQSGPKVYTPVNFAHILRVFFVLIYVYFISLQRADNDA